MEWNKIIFLKNIDELVEKYCGGNQKEFNKTIKQRDAVSRWKADDNPSFKAILKICKEFKCNIAWLLTGHEPKPNTPSNGYTAQGIQHLEDLAAANKKLNERLEQENNQLNQKVKELENEVQIIKTTWLTGRRRGDPADLDVLSLRKDNYR